MQDDSQEYPTENIVLILSKLPEFLRESMMKSQVQKLCSMNLTEREKIAEVILSGLPLVEEDPLRKVIRTWLKVVSRLESNKIFEIFATYVNIYERDQTLLEREFFTVLFEVYQSLEDNQKTMLRDCLVEVLFNQHMGRQMIFTLPMNVRSTLTLR